jgi:GMP synthase (glutamine-hydrolysing)
MKLPVTILQHDPGSPAGTIIDALDELNVPYEIRRLDAGGSLPSWPDETAGIISLGGHADVKRAGHSEVNLLRRIVNEGGPVWAIGLGAELLTMATGGEVYQKRKPELGWVTIEKAVDDPLLHGVSSPFVGFCWHTHWCKLSPMSHVTAEHNGEVEAFRAGGRAWATQFHPEITAEVAQRWIDEGVRKHHDLDPTFVDKLREQTEELLPKYAAFCRQLTLNFLAASDLLS